MFSSFKRRDFLTEKQIKYFTCLFSKATNLKSVKPKTLSIYLKMLF